MSKPVMPKATALWLIDNTKLTFAQIADFCGLHVLQIEALEEGKRGTLQPVSPLLTGQLTAEEIKRCELDPNAQISLAPVLYPPKKARKGSRYTLLSKRSDIPHAILWLTRHYPHLTDAQIAGLIGTTKPTVRGVREGTHWNYKALTPQSPVFLGLCTEEHLQSLL